MRLHPRARSKFMTPLSILDLVRVTEETDAATALVQARDLAAHAEQWGYTPASGSPSTTTCRHRECRDRGVLRRHR